MPVPEPAQPRGSVFLNGSKRRLSLVARRGPAETYAFIVSVWGKRAGHGFCFPQASPGAKTQLHPGATIISLWEGLGGKADSRHGQQLTMGEGSRLDSGEVAVRAAAGVHIFCQASKQEGQDYNRPVLSPSLERAPGGGPSAAEASPDWNGWPERPRRSHATSARPHVTVGYGFVCCRSHHRRPFCQLPSARQRRS